MGIVISAIRKTPPCGVSVRLECDAVEAFFCRGFEVFEEPDGGGYVEAHKKAMAAGWLERASPGGRLWICPACSGKT